MKYIIVQAGGKGTRLEYLTENKPKALVPIENLPMLFHLFRQYPDKRFIIIADYKKEVLHEYLECFAKVKYLIVDAEGTGTCSGVKQAIDLVPMNEPFMLVWSDLILPKDLVLPEEYSNDEKCLPQKDYVGISQTFPCRWSYIKGEFVEERSYENGVAGFFLFSDKKKLLDVPASGELVRWLREQKMQFEEFSLAGTKEFGILEEYQKLEQEKCRPFNKVLIGENTVTKEALDEQGRGLALRECRWYEHAKQLGFPLLPEIYGTNPLLMERIQGQNIYAYNLAYAQKKEILIKLIKSLEELHNAETISVDAFSLKEAYFNKTMARINQVRALIPLADQKIIRINGKECRNVFFYKKEFEKKLEQIPCEKFSFIHGDCTFSNMMLRDEGTPVLIDPRGYFGFTELYGDALYDWAKLYYSLVGNYDRFNLKEFRLHITDEVVLDIDSNHWEDMEQDFFNLVGVRQQDVKLLHAVVWLSLSTYAWQDYDSVCGAFYNGLFYLEDVL